MNALHLVLTLVLLGWSIISFIIYQARRSDSKGAMRELRRQGSPVRQLTAEEQTAILVAYKMDVAVGADVYQVQGAIQRHGLTTHGNTTWHHLIGELEVKPFPGWEALVAEQNHAEVVLAHKIALPISVNGVSLVEALAEKAHVGRVQEQLRKGEQGTVLEPADAVDEPLAVTITASRKETMEEARLRYEGTGSGWASLMWLCCVGIAIACLLPNEAQLWLAVPAVIGAVWSGWVLRQRLLHPKLQPAEIRSLRGPFQLNIATLKGGDKPVIAMGNPQVGELSVTYPVHWLVQIAENADAYHDRMCEIDIDLKNQHVVRHERLSVYEELKRFPIPRWGRHLTMVIGASITLVFCLILALPIDSALQRASRALQGSKALSASTPAAFLSQNFQVGDQLSLSGKISCLPSGKDEADQSIIQTAHNDNDLSTVCRRLGWYPASVALSLPAQSAEVQSLTKLALDIQPATPDMPMAGASSVGSEQYAAAVLLQRIAEMAGAPTMHDFNVHVLEVDSVCSQSISDDCDDLRNAMAALGDHANDWAGLLAKAKAKQLPDEMPVATDDARILATDLQAVLAQATQTADLARFRSIASLPPPALVLQMDDGDSDGLSLTTASADGQGDDSSGDTSDDPLAMLLSHAFTLRGTVMAISKDARGVPELLVHASAEPPSMLSLLGTLLLGLFSLVMLLWHALALQRQWSRGKKRTVEVNRYVEQLVGRY